MKHPGRVEDYLEHIAAAIERATRYATNAGTLEALESDEQAQDAIVRTIAVIGEAAAKIQKDAPEFTAAHPELPWSKCATSATKLFTTISMWPGISSGIRSKMICHRY